MNNQEMILDVMRSQGRADVLALRAKADNLVHDAKALPGSWEPAKGE